MKVTIKLIASSFLIAALLATCGCSGETTDTIPEVNTEPEESYTEPEKEEIVVVDLESQGLQQNENTFLAKDGWIYGQSWDHNGNSQFVKARSDLTDWTVLDTCFAQNIQIVENYIYYRGHNQSTYGIYRMRTSGEEKEQIIDTWGPLQVVGEYIYYTDAHFELEGDSYQVGEEDAHLYRCNLDGSNTTEIIAKPTFHFYVFGDKILYQDDKDNSSLHICDTDGSNDVKLNDCISYWPVISGEYIYFVREDALQELSSRSIWKMKLDGTDAQMVADYEVSSGFFMTDDHIYFTYGMDSYRVYRIQKDGSGIELVTQDTNILYIQPFGGKMKYTKYADGFQYVEYNCISDLDGSNKLIFEQ